MNFHPMVNWAIPPGTPPYKPATIEESSPHSLHYEVKKLDYYMNPSPHQLSKTQRENMYVQLLERLDPKDAEFIIAVKDKKLSYKGLTYKLVRDTWPDILPEQKEEEKQEVEEKMVVDEQVEQ